MSGIFGTAWKAILRWQKHGTMRRKINIEEVETALKEAAVAATYGSREEQSGRFLPKQSSVIAAMHYDEDEAALDITFTGGTTYRYKHVPLETYVGLMEAESQGAFFNQNIKGAFDFTEVKSGRR
jgi:hypothetical protein